MKAIQVQTETGEIVYIEVSEDVDVVGGSVGGGAVAGADDVANNMIEKLRDIGTTIADVCRTVQQQALVKLDKSVPHELTLEFGVKLAGEAGVPLITKGSVEGTFQVTATWQFGKTQKG